MCLRKCNKPCDKFTLATCLDRIRSEKELKAYKNICECGPYNSSSYIQNKTYKVVYTLQSSVKRDKGDKLMKQHITVEQLEDFVIQDEERATKLIESILEEVDFYTEAILVEYLTIGKMIEILQKHHMLITKYVNWAVVIAIKEKEHTFESEELCDALWEAVKEAL